MRHPKSCLQGWKCVYSSTFQKVTLQGALSLRTFQPFDVIKTYERFLCFLVASGAPSSDPMSSNTRMIRHEYFYEAS